MTAMTTQVNVTDGMGLATFGDNLGVSQTFQNALGTTTSTVFGSDFGDMILSDYLRITLTAGGNASAWFKIPRNCRLKEFYIDSDTTLTGGTCAVYLQPSEGNATGAVNLSGGGTAGAVGAVNLSTTTSRTVFPFATPAAGSVDNTGSNTCIRFDCATVAPATGSLYLFISYSIRSHA